MGHKTKKYEKESKRYQRTPYRLSPSTESSQSRRKEGLGSLNKYTKAIISTQIRKPSKFKTMPISKVLVKKSGFLKTYANNMNDDCDLMNEDFSNFQTRKINPLKKEEISLKLEEAKKEYTNFNNLRKTAPNFLKERKSTPAKTSLILTNSDSQNYADESFEENEESATQIDDNNNDNRLNEENEGSSNQSEDSLTIISDFSPNNDNYNKGFYSDSYLKKQPASQKTLAE